MLTRGGVLGGLIGKRKCTLRLCGDASVVRFFGFPEIREGIMMDFFAEIPISRIGI